MVSLDLNQVDSQDPNIIATESLKPVIGEKEEAMWYAHGWQIYLRNYKDENGRVQKSDLDEIINYNKMMQGRDENILGKFETVMEPQDIRHRLLILHCEDASFRDAHPLRFAGFLRFQSDLKWDSLAEAAQNLYDNYELMFGVKEEQ